VARAFQRVNLVSGEGQPLDRCLKALIVSTG
jgi:hypothetical protein